MPRNFAPSSAAGCTRAPHVYAWARMRSYARACVCLGSHAQLRARMCMPGLACAATRAHVRAVCVRANARGCLVLMVVVVVARARE
jgi:hypothetical protein